MGLLRTLFSFSGGLDRRTYLAVALIGVAIKHGVDLFLASTVFDRPWTPLNYLLPLGVPVPFSATTPADRAFLFTMLAVAVPFAWVGLAITVKRFRAVGFPPWAVVLFFVPIANIVSFAVAAALPERDEPAPPGPAWYARYIPEGALAAATFALLPTAAFGVATAAVATTVLQEYGWGLFAAIPFAQGVMAACVFAAHRRRTLGECLGVATLSVGLTAVALFALAFEGFICIVMAAPIALAFALVGGLFGFVLQNGRRIDVAASLCIALIAPGILGAEAVLPQGAPLYVVRSSIEIDAPPSAVWKDVIAFPDLPPPREPIFRVGIAYPERARIVGRGLGAVRYCEFSTGAFVEPITVWRPGRELAFDVTHNPEPMRELSPYAGLDPAHLRGYMTSRRGEFELRPLPGGRTLLVGTTWYQHHLWPAAYWAVWSDAIVHQIHMRVLNHIKRIAEAGQERSRIAGKNAPR